MAQDNRYALAEALLDMTFRDMMEFSTVLAEVVAEVTPDKPAGHQVADALTAWATQQNTVRR